MVYYARFDEAKNGQLLKEHLQNVAEMASQELDSLGFKNIGYLMGILHDLGKYQDAFQKYLLSECGITAPSDNLGKAFHACFGALYLTEEKPTIQSRDFIALSVASHHTGLYDLLSTDGELTFREKLEEWKETQHYESFMSNWDKIDPEIREALSNSSLLEACDDEMKYFIQKVKNAPYILDAKNPETKENYAWYMGLSFLQRLFYSALIHADRTDAAGRMIPRTNAVPWEDLQATLEAYMGCFKANDSSPIFGIRKAISDQCKASVVREQGIYRLTLPTGAGKTLSSLRYAVGHACKHNLRKIFYFAPFTSILEQNAEEIRKALNVGHGEVVFEHHCNVVPEQNFENTYSILSETWDAQVICSTTVQFLNALFSGESRSARRMIALRNSVIILDEIQSIPLNMLHLLANALNFLKEFMGCTLVLCSATQPLLDRIPKEFGAVKMNEDPEIVPNYMDYFEKLKRVDLNYDANLLLKNAEDWARYATEKARQQGSTLVVVSTKRFARDVYNALDHNAFDCYHLSTNMCPRHRLDSLDAIRKKLDQGGKPLIVVSTPLIEAGVDISFRCVIRMTAGLDSIAQVAGRCNRHGESESPVPVYVVNKPNDMRIPPSMEYTYNATSFAFLQYGQSPDRFGSDLLGKDLLDLYYQKAYFENAFEMQYPVGKNGETVLNLLSLNTFAGKAYAQNYQAAPPGFAPAYREAGEKFKSIDTFNDIGILVPYTSKGADLICAIQCAELKDIPSLLRQAQPYCVTISEKTKQELERKGVLHYASEDFGILYLDEQYYNEEIGLTLDEEYLAPMSFQNV